MIAYQVTVYSLQSDTFGVTQGLLVVTVSSDHLEGALVWELGGSLTEAKLSACLVQPLPVPHAKHLRFSVAQLCHRLCSGKA